MDMKEKIEEYITDYDTDMMEVIEYWLYECVERKKIVDLPKLNIHNYIFNLGNEYSYEEWREYYNIDLPNLDYDDLYLKTIYSNEIFNKIYEDFMENIKFKHNREYKAKDIMKLDIDYFREFSYCMDINHRYWGRVKRLINKDNEVL